MNEYKNKIAITTGDFNGIGAEIVIKALNKLDLPLEKVVLITNQRILDFYGKLNKNYEIISVPFEGRVCPGKLSEESGEFSFQSLKTACEIHPAAIVTAPVSKEAMHLAGHRFNGQTEVLQHFLAKNGEQAEMLFISNGFDVFLMTRHCPLAKVRVTKDMIVDKVQRLNDFYGTGTKFALCSLNPHAGEDGILGNEENEIIIPAVHELKRIGIDITMPMPSDTLFIDAVQSYIKRKKAPYDCYIAMYHDQGLIPIKAVAGDTTVNTTIGLPILRTSPCHGTAFDIAGKNVAKYDSMVEAINTAIMIKRVMANTELIG